MIGYLNFPEWLRPEIIPGLPIFLISSNHLTRWMMLGSQCAERRDALWVIIYVYQAKMH